MSNTGLLLRRAILREAEDPMKETDDDEQAKLDNKIEQQQSEMKDDNTKSGNLSLKEMVDSMLNENEKLRSVDTEKFYSILEEVLVEKLV